MTPHVYNAVIERVVDGDTLNADVDLGFYVHLVKRNVRLAHCNAPELSTPEGVVAKTFVEGLLAPGTAVLLQSHELDKYGRILATVALPDGRDLSTVLIAAGHAVPYEGGPR